MNMLLAIFLGGGAGSLTRHYSVLMASRFFGDVFPYGTLAVNIIGSFLIGAIVESVALKYDMSLEMRAFIVTGFLGGFTTFSAFSLDFFKLAEAGHMPMALVYAVFSIFLSLLAVYAGIFLMRGVLN
jgi:CrcB protein